MYRRFKARATDVKHFTSTVPCKSEAGNLESCMLPLDEIDRLGQEHAMHCHKRHPGNSEHVQGGTHDKLRTDFPAQPLLCSSGAIVSQCAM